MKRQILLAVLIIAFEWTFATAATTTAKRGPQEVRLGNAAPIPNGIVPPSLVSYTRPVYTDEARRRGIEGVVRVEASFDIDGTFKVLRVVKGLGYGLDESALAAVKRWRFAPAYQNGQRVSVVTWIEVSFSLFDDPQWLREQNLPVQLEKRKWGIESIRSTVERSGE